MPTTATHPPTRTAPRHTGRRLRVLALLLLVIAAGCKTGDLVGKDKKYDLLEAELRTREREILELRGEVQQQRQLNLTYQRQPAWGEATHVLPGYAQHGGQAAPTGQAPTLPLKEISLGGGTGGVDEDGKPGDESLMVVVVPKDDDGTAVKLPGQAVIAAYEISPQGLKSQIGQWNVTPDQLRRAWKSGLLSSGYFIPLQWDKLPGTDRLRIVARFTSNDGRVFEADKDVTVRVLPGSRPGGLPPPTVTPPPSSLPPQDVPTGPAEELPPPKRSSARLKWVR